MNEHEDVQLLLDCETLEALELVAEDPKYYLNLIMNYKKTASGEEIYLPFLLNIKTQQENGVLIIKFKLSPTSRWYEVGYSTGNEEQTYAAFSKKVYELIKFPPPERGHLISEALEDIPMPNVTETVSPTNNEDAPEPSEPTATKEKEKETDYITELYNCRELCAEESQTKYNMIIGILTSSDAFVKKQVALLPMATEAQRICILHFLTDYIVHRS
jgi:hypothetical protein